MRTSKKDYFQVSVEAFCLAVAAVMLMILIISKMTEKPHTYDAAVITKLIEQHEHEAAMQVSTDRVFAQFNR